jgi:hypothetical protein
MTVLTRLAGWVLVVLICLKALGVILFGSPTRQAEWLLVILTGLVAVGAVFFRRKYVAASQGGTGRVAYGVFTAICLLLFIWFFGTILFTTIIDWFG